MKAIGTRDDLLEARAVPRALIFLWVNWAGRPVSQRSHWKSCWRPGNTPFPSTRFQLTAPTSATKLGRSGKRPGRGLRLKPVQSIR
jgi:hypothetical protein